MTALRIFVLAYAAATAFAVLSYRLRLPEALDFGFALLVAYVAWRWVRALEKRAGQGK